MADTKAPASSPEPVKEAMDRWRLAEERERENRELAYEDLNFRAGEQWPDREKKRLEEEGRPALTLNRIPTFVRQVTNDIRLMRPSIRVVPVDSQGDVKTADTMAGMIRYVENRSDAQAAYFIGMDSQVVAGIGHWQVITEYASERTFEQEVRIVPVDDGVAVLWDPDSVLPTREDAMWCFQPVDMTRAAFKAKYPKAKAEDLEADGAPTGWATDDTIRVARYWCKKPVKRTLALMPDGAVQECDTPEKLQQAQMTGARIEERDGYKITSCILSASEIIEPEKDWPGRFIPVVPVLGEEVRIGRKVVRHGAIRYVKDAQRMYNYAQSTFVEAIALQPKAPFLVTEDQVKTHAATWNRANDAPLPYLPYTVDPKAPTVVPQRSTPPIASQGLAEMINLAGQDMKDIIGIQDAGLGQKSNETSGKAIIARQREGDVGMYTYVDNFSRAVRHTGTILVDLIPRIYDTERMIRIMGEDGAVDLVLINQQQMDPASGQVNVINDLTIGAYDVVVQQGPGYTTRREEAREGMLELTKMAPDVLIPLLLDKIAKALDWPMADEIAARARAIIPPAVLQAEEQAKSGAPPAPPQPEQPGPDQITAVANAEKAQANADEAKSKAKMADIDLGHKLADSILGPVPQPMTAPVPGQAPEQMPQAA